MKIAIIHDYIKEYGGAERVLEALCEIYPDAPIYTAFCDKGSTAYVHFKNKKIKTSWFQYLPFAPKLASPLRFLTPLIWGSFNFSEYDIVISSASWYITKGFGNNQKKPIEICYCHTPPRWLYGYSTSVNFQKYLLVRAYAAIVGHFLRLYDFERAQKVNYFIANSKEVAGRIKKFYRRDSTVIHPPVSLPKTKLQAPKHKDYYFIVSRIVGAKGLEMAVQASLKGNFKLKIAGSPAGYYFEQNKLLKQAGGRVEFLGQVTDEELVRSYKGAKGFLALAKDEDFGITPVEAMSCGTPVVAFNGGGYKETVIDGKTGILFNDYSTKGLLSAIEKFEKTKINSQDCVKQAEKFSKERFRKEIKDFISSKLVES
ncbi:glycosyltransferase [Patescibacteria group bacterium]|nr:glycosyltransferase [Patescibacteria group bacterium]